MQGSWRPLSRQMLHCSTGLALGNVGVVCWPSISKFVCPLNGIFDGGTVEFLTNKTWINIFSDVWYEGPVKIRNKLSIGYTNKNILDKPSQINNLSVKHTLILPVAQCVIFGNWRRRSRLRRASRNSRDKPQGLRYFVCTQNCLCSNRRESDGTFSSTDALGD